MGEGEISNSKGSMPYLRHADMTDADVILEWVNDPADRANSFDSHVITREEHISWMKRALSDERIHLYVMESEGNKVGHIKLYIDGDQAEIGYCIAPEWRGHGYGKLAIVMLIDEVKTNFPKIAKLVAETKPNNIASRCALVGAGFDETSIKYEVTLR